MAKYLHIIDRLINTPLAISATKLDIITNNVIIKLIAGEGIDDFSPTPSPDTASSVENNGKQIAIIPVSGSLVNKNGAGASGMTSYARVKALVKDEIAMGSTDIIFDISSPGGEVGGLFPLTDFIATLPSLGISTYGYTDSEACSAAYAILSSCQKVFATDLATVGSIGVVATLVDLTKQDSMEGVKYEIFRSKQDKAAYNPHEPITDKIKADVIQRITEADTKFNNSVLAYRNGKVTMETIVKLAGSTVRATEAVTIGLIDGVVTGIEEVIAEITTPISSKTTQTMLNNNGVNQMSEIVTLEAYVALQTELATLKDAQTLEVAKAVKAERNRCEKILESATTFKVKPESVNKAIAKGWALDMVADYFSDLAEAQDVATAIQTGASSLSSADANFKDSLGKEVNYLDALVNAGEANG